jgi:flagellar basal-body rod modification protein FlgD
MDISSLTNSFPTPSADQISSRGEAMDRADFLRMLVTQMTVQDPLNPLQGSEFASQLAQFSSLQELQNMGGTLEQSLQANLILAQSINNTMATSIIGKVVRANTDRVHIGSAGDATLNYNLSSAATSITVEVKDSSGAVVRTMNVSPQAAGDHALAWDGLDNEGVRVASGEYTFSVNATSADGSTVPATTFVEGRITGVNYSSGQATLLMGDLEILLSEVISISESTDKRRG